MVSVTVAKVVHIDAVLIQTAGTLLHSGEKSTPVLSLSLLPGPATRTRAFHLEQTHFRQHISLFRDILTMLDNNNNNNKNALGMCQYRRSILTVNDHFCVTADNHSSLSVGHSDLCPMTNEIGISRERPIHFECN